MTHESGILMNIRHILCCSTELYQLYMAIQCLLLEVVMLLRIIYVHSIIRNIMLHTDKFFSWVKGMFKGLHPNTNVHNKYISHVCVSECVYVCVYICIYKSNMLWNIKKFNNSTKKKNLHRNSKCIIIKYVIEGYA